MMFAREASITALAAALVLLVHGEVQGKKMQENEETTDSKWGGAEEGGFLAVFGIPMAVAGLVVTFFGLSRVSSLFGSKGARPGETFTVKVVKPTSDARVGVVLTNDGHGKVLVDEIKTQGLCAGTKLSVGDECLSINNVRVHDATSAAVMIRDSGGSVTISARRQMQKLLDASLRSNEELQEHDRGVEQMFDKNAGPVSSWRDYSAKEETKNPSKKKSVSSFTRLRRADRVTETRSSTKKPKSQANGGPRRRMSLENVKLPSLPSMPSMKKVGGKKSVSQAATKRGPTFSVTVVKHTQDSRVGIVLTNGVGGEAGLIVVDEIKSSGLVANTELRIGDECCSVNGVRCNDATTAANMIRDGTGQVTIVGRHAIASDDA